MLQTQPCPGIKCPECHACKQSGHFIGAPICPGPSKENKAGTAKARVKVKKVGSSITRDESEEEESDTDTIGRIKSITVGAVSTSSTDVEVMVGIRPRTCLKQTWIQWTADSGVKRTLLSETGWKEMKEYNAAAKLRKNCIKFVPYGTKQTLPVMGKVKVQLQCEEGKRIYTTVYVVAGQQENLLGERDAVALGIINIKPRGDQPGDTVETVGHIHSMKKEKPTEIASGGQTQADIDRDMDAILVQFKELFSGIGVVKIPPIQIYMKEGAQPVAQRQRPVPVHLMKPLREKLDEFLKEGVIEGPLGSEQARGWVHNIVLTKKKWDDKAVRLNIDTRAMEKYAEVPHFPIPTAEQLRHKFLGSDRFTVVDLNHAFHQFRLTESSKDLFKFTTPYGLFRYNRLVMGAHAASAECHAKLSQILEGLPGVVQIKDDVCIHGVGREHDKRLLAVLHKFKEYGITLRKEKCKLGQTEVVWFGNVFHKGGTSPDPAKVDIIKGWPSPEDKTALKSFLQTVQFCSPYMRAGDGQTYSDITAPLRKLTAQGKHFKWTEECQSSFQKLKDLLRSDTVLASYDPHRHTRVYVDHGPHGLASTLAQAYQTPGYREPQYRPVIHHSRALTKAEMGYGKIEGESLSILAGVKINSTYLYGTKFEVVTDHEPLVPLYNSPTRPAPVRVERHRSKLRSFRFTTIHHPGKTIPCDYASRHPPPVRSYTSQEKEDLGVEEEEEDAEIQIGRVLAELAGNTVMVGRVDMDPPPAAITEKELQQVMERDQDMVKLVKAVQTGLGIKELPKNPYTRVVQELSYAKGMLVRGTQVVIPRELQGRAVALAHEGHEGIEPTLRNLRDKVWFPYMADMVKEYVGSCLGCVASVPFNPPAPITTRDPPDGPWEVCCADYKGPIGGPRGYYFHVLIDTYSKWPEVAYTTSTKFEKLFPALEKSFANHGYPDKVIHDGGPPYNGQAWADYAKQSGFDTALCTPEHPQANGQAEKFMSSIVKITHASIAEGRDPKEEILKFLLNYRNTPHSSTGVTPASLMMNRDLKTKLPSIRRRLTTAHHQQARENDAAAKSKQKEYADRHRRAKEKEFKEGDKVLIHQKKTTTKPPYNPDPYTVTQIKGTQITAIRRGSHMTRNVDKWKILKNRALHLRTLGQRHTVVRTEESDSEDDFDLPARTAVPALPQQAPRDPPQQHAEEVGAAAQQPAHTTPRQAPREMWQVAHGPWRDKKANPSPRERKRLQQAARKRDKEQKDIPYQLRSRGKIAEPELSEEEMF